MSASISELLRVIPLAMEEKISRTIYVDSVLPITPTYYKSMWKIAGAKNEKAISRRRSHILNYAYVFILSLISCLAMAAPVCTLPLVYFIRFEYLDGMSSIKYGSLAASTDAAACFSILLTGLPLYFYGWSRNFIIILVIGYVLSTIFYFCSMFYVVDNQYYGIIILYAWRSLLGFQGIIQVMGVIYCCYYSQHEIKSNSFAFLLVSSHTNTHVYIWAAYGPILGLIFINTGQIAFNHKEPITSLIFNSFTAYSWVVFILMMIFGIYFNTHFRIFYLDKKKDEATMTCSYNNITTEQNEGAIDIKDIEQQEVRNISNRGKHNIYFNSSYYSNRNIPDPKTLEKQTNELNECEKNITSSNKKDDEDNIISNWTDVMSTNINLFNSITTEHQSKNKKEISSHKDEALSLVHTSLVLLICSEAFLVVLFYGFFWNSFTIAYGFGVISDSQNVYKAYIALIFGSLFAIIFKWDNILWIFLSRYNMSVPRISGGMVGVFLVMLSSILILLAAILLDNGVTLYNVSNSNQKFNCSNCISLYHAASFFFGLGFVWSFISCEALVFYLSGYVTVNDKQLMTLGKFPNSSSNNSLSSMDNIEPQELSKNHWFRIKYVHSLRMALIVISRGLGIFASASILSFFPDNLNSNFNSSSYNNGQCIIPWLVGRLNEAHSTKFSLPSCRVDNLLVLSWLYLALSFAAFAIYLSLWAFIMDNASLKFLVSKKLDKYAGHTSGSVFDKKEVSILRHLGFDINDIEVID